MIGIFQIIPKPLQMIIAIVGAIVGAMFISSAMGAWLNVESMNPLITFLIGLGIILVTGKYVMMR